MNDIKKIVYLFVHKNKIKHICEQYHVIFVSDSYDFKGISYKRTNYRYAFNYRDSRYLKKHEYIYKSNCYSHTGILLPKNY